MGGKASKSAMSSKELKHVFASELQTVTDVIDHVLRSDNTFVAEDYNFLTRETCDRYTFVLQSQLNRHLKIDVQHLHDSVILVPKAERVAASDQKTVIDKKELCQTIAQHYVKLLYVLCLVKYVYDVENSGDFSVAGIVRRNTRRVGDLLEVNYCSLPQKDYERKDKRVHFGALKGLQFLVEHFLAPEEQRTFLAQLRMIVARSANPDALQRIACHDVNLLRPRDYQALYGPMTLRCPKTAVAPENDRPAAADMAFHVAPFNPILSSDVCMSKKKIVVQLSASKPTALAYERLHKRYAENVRDVEALLARLVAKKKTGAYELRVISDAELDAIVADVKSIVAKFFLASVLDYQRLLDVAREAGVGVDVAV
jgi:hypothetical protein